MSQNSAECLYEPFTYLCLQQVTFKRLGWPQLLNFMKDPLFWKENLRSVS